MIICLGRPSPDASCDRPWGDGGAGHTPSPLCGLAPGGVYRAGPVAGAAGALLPHRFTLARCRPLALASDRPLAVYSLLHFPWARAPWELPSTLPCGVRTFLDGPAGAGPAAITWETRIPARGPAFRSRADPRAHSPLAARRGTPRRQTARPPASLPRTAA